MCPLSLREAIESKDYSYLKNYLVNEQNIYSRDIDGSTALQIALLMDDIEMVRFLLEHKADPNQCYLYGKWEGYSPLHFALSVRSSAMAMLLIEYGADIFAKSPGMLPAICVAIINNRLRVLRYLMDNWMSPDTLIDNDTSLLTYAVIKGNIRIVRCILAYKPNVNLHQNQRALVKSICMSGSRSKRLVKLLYKYGFTLQPTDINPDLIYKAINHGHYEAVLNLLQLGVSPNFEIIYNLNTNETENILHTAVLSGELKLVRLLLEYGANIHCRDYYEQTPILIAAELKNVHIIKLLLKYGADVTDTDSYGYTVLHFAAREDMENIYKNLKPHRNNTITKIVRIFISKGADVNAKTNHHYSVLHYAAFTGSAGALLVLLANGARVDGINSQSMTPFDLAMVEVENYIIEANSSQYTRDFKLLKLCTFHLLQNHIHRLHRIGLPICLRDLMESSHPVCQLHDEVSKFIDDEIDFIKITKIGDCHITLLRFLTCTDKKAVGLVRNEVFLKDLKALLYRPDKFPGYVELIRNKLTVALKKIKLDTVTFRLIYFFFREKKLPSLPDECIEHIISYLSDEDKEIVINQFTKKIKTKKRIDFINL